jgi:hypothetical protein
MDLILWRHAEAEDAGPGMSDLERALTSKGQSRRGAWASGSTRSWPTAANPVQPRRAHLADGGSAGP